MLSQEREEEYEEEYGTCKCSAWLEVGVGAVPWGHVSS